MATVIGLDIGAVQHADANGKRLDIGAVAVSVLADVVEDVTVSVSWTLDQDRKVWKIHPEIKTWSIEAALKTWKVNPYP